MASEFDTLFTADAFPELLERLGESITITRASRKTYDPATGGAAAGSPADAVVPATAIVEELTIVENGELRATGNLKVTTATALSEGDTVTIRSMKYRVKNVSEPVAGIYQFEAHR